MNSETSKLGTVNEFTHLPGEWGVLHLKGLIQ